jgi:hypothetical protein
VAASSWPSAAAGPFALRFYSHSRGAHTLFGGSVHMMRSVLIRAKGAAIFRSFSPLRKRVDQVRNLRSRPRGIRSDGPLQAASLTALGSMLWQASTSSLASRSPPSSPKPSGLRGCGRYAADRRPPRCSINCAKAPRTSSPLPPPPASLSSCPLGRLSFLRGA